MPPLPPLSTQPHPASQEEEPTYSQITKGDLHPETLDLLRATFDFVVKLARDLTDEKNEKTGKYIIARTIEELKIKLTE